MMNRWVIIGLVILLGGTGFCAETEHAYAADTEKPWVSKIVSIQGRVVVKRQGDAQWQPVKLNDTLFPGDRMRVEANSRAGIVLRNDAVLRLDQNTTLVFTEIEKETTFIFKLLKGAANFFSRRPRSLIIFTPFVNGVVEGTEFFVRVDDKQTRIDLFEGRLRAENQYGELLLAKGQGALATADSAPQRRVLVKPRDSVQWALYYPPTLALGPDDVPELLQNSLTAYNQGRTLEAIDALSQVKEADQDARFHTYRAALLLHQGRVFQARDDLQQAMALDPDNGEALALMAVISVVQNQKEEALSTAQKAVSRTPSLAAAHLALSYAQQALFNLPEALEAAQTATARAPENGTVWARLAELRLSTGALDQGIQAARKSAELNPHVARAHTILGFAYLTQIKTDMARDAFEKAIALDSAAPLPRLGLGLARIRDGDLKQGRAEIEIAAGLAPLNALIRSYLGKAYFDEKRGALDATQLEIAKTLDPNDPTPYFYSAIQKQTENRPVEALQDLQKSIELNNNRAVYRSKLLLDDDLAARSASLGRIYNDLGFQQLALVEGWKSVNTAPANYSAHRFLADSYAVLPRHEIARTSELYQSQLLQPLNITPVQPELAASNLFILEGAGPSDLSFNEYNPLFLRNRLALQGNGVVGNNDTWGDVITQSGVWNKVSYSLGQFHYETDGFRENNDQNLNLYNAFVQASLTSKTSILGEYRYSDFETGDLELTFKESFIPTLRQEEKTKEIRFGLRHEFTPHSNFLASFIHQDAKLDTVVFPDFWELESEFDVYVGEIGYLHQTERFNITVGGGHRKQDQLERDLGFPDVETDSKFTNAYAYSQITLHQLLRVTLGASGDFLEAGERGEDRDQFNPKLGLIWNPAPSTTLRAAIFQTLERPRASQRNSDPTLEPTQVAGFNQFFVGAEGDRVWRYGVGIDQKIQHNIFGGVEISARDIDAQLIDETGPEPVVTRRDWTEFQMKAYLNWTPFDQLALSTEYLFENFKREEVGGFLGVEEFKELRTHRFPILVRYFHPSGFGAGAKATYVYQDGDFLVGDGFGGYTIEAGDDQFWILDASISYRLPKRYGLISLEAKNLLDREFLFQDTDPGNPRILPERFILLTATLAF